jgi:hypothetical protein
MLAAVVSARNMHRHAFHFDFAVTTQADVRWQQRQ